MTLFRSNRLCRRVSQTIEATVTFSGGKRVDAAIGDHVIRTDQPVAKGGDGSAPSPFDTFLGALGTCAGIYVLGFCNSRGLDTEGVELRQRACFDEGGVLDHIDLEIEVPSTFPARYHKALVRAAEQCAVKKVIAAQPAIQARTVVREDTVAA